MSSPELFTSSFVWGVLLVISVVMLTIAVIVSLMTEKAPPGPAPLEEDDPFENLQPKDETKPNTEQGLYGKYFILRSDGTSEPGMKHEDCQYFVLDLTHDIYALETLHYYSKACEKTHPELSRDLRRKVSLGFQDMEDRGVI